MSKNLLALCLAAAALALLADQAVVYTFAVEEKSFGGLAACDTPTLPGGQGAGDGQPKVEINLCPVVNPNRPSRPTALRFDLLRLQMLNLNCDTATLPGSLLLGGDFSVGGTSGGSAAPAALLATTTDSPMSHRVHHSFRATTLRVRMSPMGRQRPVEPRRSSRSVGHGPCLPPVVPRGPRAAATVTGNLSSAPTSGRWRRQLELHCLGRADLYSESFIWRWPDG